MRFLKKCLQFIAGTPLHPQWLMGARRPPAGLLDVQGVVLDIGAGDRWIQAFVPDSARYIALDYPPTGKLLYGARPDVFADASQLPLQDGIIDAICCLEVLEHVPEPSAVLMEISRVLKSGGRVWLSMPFLYPLHDAPFDFQRFTEFGLRKHAMDAGLDVVTYRKSGHSLRSAGVAASLAVAGPVNERIRVLWPLLPAVLGWVVSVNLVFWTLSHLWPDWRAMSLGHELELRKA